MEFQINVDGNALSQAFIDKCHPLKTVLYLLVQITYFVTAIFIKKIHAFDIPLRTVTNRNALLFRSATTIFILYLKKMYSLIRITANPNLLAILLAILMHYIHIMACRVKVQGIVMHYSPATCFLNIILRLGSSQQFLKYGKCCNKLCVNPVH